MIKILIALLISFSALADGHLTGGEESESEFNVRLFKKLRDNTRLLFELKVRDEAEDNQVKSFRTGGYIRLKKNWKVGLFYERASGLLHDTDWIREWKGGKWVWHWDDTSDRYEDMYTLDLTYRTVIANNTVFEFKNRFTHNDYNSNNFLRIRPGLTYFWKKDAMPFINWFLQYEAYVPTSDYTDESIYESWLYLGMLYHLDSTYKLGSFVAKKNVKWESGELKAKVLGLNFFVYF